MRLVLDTNVIVSAIFWGGKPGKVFEIAQSQHKLCFTPETLRELQAVLAYQKFEREIQKLHFSVQEFIQRLAESAIVIPNPPELSIIQDDPSDNKFLACALACQASFIISGDQHLLKLKKFHYIEILSPSAFLRKLNFPKE